MCWCVCQDNNPGTRNLELGHTIIKIKCAASRVIEDSSNQYSVEELRARLEDGGRREKMIEECTHGTEKAVASSTR